MPKLAACLFALAYLLSCGPAGPAPEPLQPGVIELDDPAESTKADTQLAHLGAGASQRMGQEPAVVATAEPEPEPIPMRLIELVLEPSHPVPRGLAHLEVGEYEPLGRGRNSLHRELQQRVRLRGDPPKVLELTVPEAAEGLWVRLSAEGYQARKSLLRLSPSKQRYKSKLHVERGWTLPGIARLEDGTSPERISLSTRKAEGLRLRSLRATGEGRFELSGSGLGSAELALDAKHQGFGLGALEVTEQGELVEPLEVVLRGDAQLLGRLVDGQGEPVMGVHVAAVLEEQAELIVGQSPSRIYKHGRALGSAQGQGLAQATSDVTGRFALRGLAAGTYCLAAVPDSGTTLQRLVESQVPTTEEEATYVIQAQRLRVTLVDPEQGRLVFSPHTRVRMKEQDGARVTLDGRPVLSLRGRHPRTGKPLAKPRWFPTGAPDAWDVRLHPGMAYTLQVQALDRPLHEQPLVLPAGVGRAEVAVHLPGRRLPAELLITVEAPASTASTDAFSLRAVSEQGPSHSLGQALPDSDPRQFAARVRLPAGRWEVHAQPVGEEAYLWDLDPSKPTTLAQPPCQPFQVSAKVDLVAGGRQELPLAALPRATLLLNAPDDLKGWTLELRQGSQGPALARWSSKVGFGEADVALRPGSYGLAATVGGQALPIQELDLAGGRAEPWVLSADGLSRGALPYDFVQFGGCHW